MDAETARPSAIEAVAEATPTELVVGVKSETQAEGKKRAIKLEAELDAEDLLEQQRRRKISHSAIERRRRQRINEKVAQLQRLLPDCADREGLQMAFVLQKAIDHIERLNAENQAFRNERAYLMPTAVGAGYPMAVQQHATVSSIMHAPYRSDVPMMASMQPQPPAVQQRAPQQHIQLPPLIPNTQTVVTPSWTMTIAQPRPQQPPAQQQQQQDVSAAAGPRSSFGSIAMLIHK